MATAPNVLATDYWPTLDVTGGSATTVQVWTSWNQGYQTYPTAQTTVMNAQVWGAWNSMQQLGNSMQQLGNYQPTRLVPEPTVEQLRAQQEADFKRRQKQKDARERAEALLLSILNRNQREQYQKDKSFELQVNDRLYRIKPGQRVERLNKATKKIESYFCIHPSAAYNLPGEDWAVAQKLFLEANEKEFLRIANETRAA